MPIALASKFRQLIGLEKKGSLAAPEPWLFDLFGARPSSAGIVVTPRIAMECAPVHCAVQLISEAIGGLPVPVYKRAVDGAKTADTNHPAYALLHDAANDWTAAGTFREQITRDALLYPFGGFAFVNRVDGGKPAELIRIDPELTPVSVTYENSEPVYKVGADIIDRQNLLHLPSPSLCGRGLIHEGREAIGLALTLERHAGRLFGNGARPSGVLALKGNLTPDALTRAKAAWQAAHGGTNSGGTAVIPSEASWQSLTFTSVDSQFLELRQFAINEIARLFRVPPHMLFEMDRATWSNSEQMGAEFLIYTLLPWIRRWEAEIALKLFTPEERRLYVAKFQTDQFARPDYLQLIEGLGKAVAARILNPNEARAKIDEPPYAGGEQFINPAIETTAAAKVLNP
ncbi:MULTISPECIES: phage portal protein [unclassified Bradyrhizobium]|uniref:phage portal protein n=1 Tax=unclassified Bradyrhizobium TaxID=2631580 RepID=UPI00291636D9|nr:MULTISPECIES: phage portal protein [unclassified Bradyrhizobium]